MRKSKSFYCIRDVPAMNGKPAHRIYRSQRSKLVFKVTTLDTSATPAPIQR